MKYVQLKDGRNAVVLAGNREEILDHQIGIFAQGGSGKTVATTTGIYRYYENDYNIISLLDVKGLMEMGFLAFPPQKKWHLQKLKEQGMTPTKLPIKIIMPFSFDIPSQEIPETQFVSFSLKDLGDIEFSFLIENEEDTTTPEILKNARDKLGNSENLWDYARLCEEETERKLKKMGSYVAIKMPDKKRFSLRGVSTTTVRGVDQVYQSLQAFQKHLFLMPQNFKYNLDMERDFFSNPKVVKIVSCRYIKDQKTKDFFLLMLFNKIINEAHKSKHGILIIFDEIRGVLGEGDKRTFKKILAREIGKNLPVNLRGNHISSISTSQSFSSISSSLLKSNAFTRTFIGQITGSYDIDSMTKIFRYSTETINVIMQLDLSQYLIRGIPNYDPTVEESVTSLVPPCGICSAGDNFDLMWKKFYPDRMHSYIDLKREIAELKKKWSDEAYKTAKEKAQKEIAELEEHRRKKEQEAELKEKVIELKKEKATGKQREKQERNEKLWEDHKAGMSQLNLAKKYKISQPMVFKVLRRFRKQGG